MRYIPLLNQHPGYDRDEKTNQKINEFLAKAEELRIQMIKADTDEQRLEIIDDNAGLWTEMKDWLMELSYGKCWYTEALDCSNHWEVEHFRPKKTAKERNGDEVCGYWWLAFDWRNFRLSGNVPNRKKGTIFPIKKGFQRIKSTEDFRQEENFLLDPTDIDDPKLLTFNFMGKAIPSPSCKNDEEIDRVNYSIDRYSLNDYPPLVDNRKKTWKNIYDLVQKYLSEVDEYDRSKSQYSKALSRATLDQIYLLLSPKVEFSKVYRASIASTGDKRITWILDEVP